MTFVSVTNNSQFYFISGLFYYLRDYSFLMLRCLVSNRAVSYKTSTAIHIRFIHCIYTT